MKHLKEALEYYLWDYLRVYADEHNLDVYDLEEYIFDEEYHEMIELDLVDKGFSSDEVKEIIGSIDYEINTDRISKETAYKFIAYYICLHNYGNFDTIEELEMIMENGLEWSADDFTEEELDGIVKYKEFVEY